MFTWLEERKYFKDTKMDLWCYPRRLCCIKTVKLYSLPSSYFWLYPRFCYCYFYPSMVSSSRPAYAGICSSTTSYYYLTLAQGNWTGCFAARSESNGLWTSHTLLLQLPERDTDVRYLAGFPTPELYSPTSQGRAFTKPTPLSCNSPSFRCFHRAFLLFIHQLLRPPINLGYRWSQSHPASFTKFAWRACGGGTRIRSAELWLCSRARYR